VTLRKSGSKLEHLGLKAEMFGEIGEQVNSLFYFTIIISPVPLHKECGNVKYSIIIFCDCRMIIDRSGFSQRTVACMSSLLSGLDELSLRRCF
jgi:hypothetical protein